MHVCIARDDHQLLSELSGFVQALGAELGPLISFQELSVTTQPASASGSSGAPPHVIGHVLTLCHTVMYAGPVGHKSACTQSCCSSAVVAPCPLSAVARMRGARASRRWRVSRADWCTCWRCFMPLQQHGMHAGCMARKTYCWRVGRMQTC